MHLPRNLFRFCICALLGLNLSTAEAGKLGNFKKDTEKEQKRNEQKKEEKAKEQTTGTDSKSSRECGFLCDFFGAIFSAIGKAWIDYNTSIYYDDYPYAGKAPVWARTQEPDKKIRRVKVEPASSATPNADFEEENYIDGKETVMSQKADGTYEFKEVPKYRLRLVRRNDTATAPTKTAEREVTDLVMPAGKRSFYNIEAALLYLDRETYGFGGGFQTRFLGLFGLIGEYRQYRDQSDKLIYSSFGGEFALAQGSGVSWSFYFQYNGFSGLMALSGFGYGTRLQIFPGAGTVIDARIGKMEMTSISFWDYDLRLGLFIGRVQLFAGYRAIEAQEASLAGFQAGLQVWF